MKNQEMEIEMLKQEIEHLKKLIVNKLVKQIAKNNNKPLLKSSGWTGAYAKDNFLVVTLEQGSIPSDWFLTSETSNWVKYRNGTKKLEVSGKISENQILLKLNQEWVPLEIPEKAMKKLEKIQEKKKLSLDKELQTTVWLKENRATFSFDITKALI